MGLEQFLTDLPAGFLGTLPGWITASSSATLLGLFWRYKLGLAKVQVEAQNVQVEGKKVEQAEDADIRDHWAQEITRLQNMLTEQDKRHNEALTAMEERHGRAMLHNEERQAKCEQERERLAEKVKVLGQELEGVMQQVRMNSAEQVVLLAASDEPVPPHALAAAKRIVERNGG